MAGPQQYYVPPPPEFGGPMFKKPTSGKAIASLILGLVGSFCIPALPPLIGLVLGFFGILETGSKGSRSGRGLAIAGTIISALSIAFFVVGVAVFVYATDQLIEGFDEAMEAQLEADQQLVLERLKTYYDQNEQSLGPGGPVLATQGQPAYGGTDYRTPPANVPLPANGVPAVDTRPRVVGALTLKDLVGEHELAYGSRSGGSGMGWELTISGKASATIRATDWNGTVVREVDIRDIGRNQIIQVK